MAGRPKIFTEQDVVDRAIDVFWKKGFEATSAEELLTAMNIGKGSFYLSFKGGKKELYEKSLEQFSQKAMEQFKNNLAKTNDSVLFLKNFFLSIADSPKERQLDGCYLGNAIIEMSNVDTTTKDKAIKLLSQLEKSFREIIDQAQKQNKIKTKESPDVVAKMLINLWNGLHVTRRMYPGSKSLKPLIAFQLQVLE